jgi:Tol biopolymer transport system component
MRRLTTFGGKNRFPLWSADGRRITFQSERGGDLGLFWTPADGSGTPERLSKAEPGTAHVPESWSPDGKVLLYSIVGGPRVSLWMLSVVDGSTRPFDTVESSTPTNAVFSPDGRWVAYASTERTAAERIYLQPVPPTGAKYEIPPIPGDNPHEPLWSPDGKELVYVPRVGGFNVVSIRTQPTVTFGNPTPVVRAFDIAPNTTPRTFDVTRDGRFVGLAALDQETTVNAAAPTTAGTAPQRRIEVVLNWFEELKARVPTK